MFMNYRLPPSSDFMATSTQGRADIGHHAHIALEEGRGRITLETDKLFRLVFEPSEKAPRWTEMKVALLDKGWLDCRNIHLKYCAKSEEPMHVQAALRLHSETGFRDHFASEHHEIESASNHFGAEFYLSPRTLNKIHACDLHLFFDTTANTFDLHSLVVTGLR